MCIPWANLWENPFHHIILLNFLWTELESSFYGDSSKLKTKEKEMLSWKKKTTTTTDINKQTNKVLNETWVNIKISIWFTSIEKTNWRVKFIMVSLLKITWNFISRHHQGSTLKRVATKLLSTILLVFQCN